MKCKKHKLDYTGNFTHPEEALCASERAVYARYLCPYCKKIEDIKIVKGLRD